MTLAPRARHTLAMKLQRNIAACHSYRIVLPRGHWQLTILATVGRDSQHAAARY